MTRPAPSPTTPWVKALSLWLCLISLAYAGALTLAWATAPWLMDLAIHWRMKPNSALSLSLVAISLLAYRVSENRPAQCATLRLLALLTNFGALAIASATLMEYAAGINLHIDLLWARDALNSEGSFAPGRMAPNAALTILFLSLETLFSRSFRRAKGLAALMLSLCALITLLALLGYAYGARDFYSFSSFIRIAPSTAAIGFLLCISQALESRSGVLSQIIMSPYSGSRMARHFLPALLLPALAGWLEVVGRERSWWSREDGATLLVAVEIAVFFAFILRAALDQNRADEQEIRVSGALRTLNALGTRLAAEHDQKKLTELVTKAATQVTGAEYGAFFYTSYDAEGIARILCSTTSPLLAKLPMPASAAEFAPVLHGEVLRSANLRKDARYRIPLGDIPVTSYLAVPVNSRSGKNLGTLLFGHSQEDRFTEDHEELVSSLAAQAAVALDNSQLYQDLNHAVKARDDFLSMASHELKTPLTSLTLQLQLAQKRLEIEPEKVARALAVCQEQSRRINGLVEDLLDVSRIELGKLHFKFEPVDLAELVEDAATRLADLLRKSRCEFKVEIKVARPFPVEADRFRLDQVLENLLSNAAKYGAEKPISLRLEEIEGFALITVADQGFGVPKDKQSLIFNRFERVGDNVNISGLGLGLFISREIVLAHHGLITVESDSGKGAAFTVRLPTHQPSI